TLPPSGKTPRSPTGTATPKPPPCWRERCEIGRTTCNDNHLSRPQLNHMPAADQIKALLKSHAEGDDTRFYSVAMQIAASEARKGHGQLAQEIREMIDAARSGTASEGAKPVSIARPRGELAELLSMTQPKTRLADM